ncbi:MAG: hypothetical protein Q4G69_06845 [Planctomycetia bacterium]|nr:hypothetical protein [Planctomycetia bacterium]
MFTDNHEWDFEKAMFFEKTGEAEKNVDLCVRFESERWDGWRPRPRSGGAAAPSTRCRAIGE